MTYPVFATGDPWPASDANAIGLWLVKSQTIGTGVSSVSVTNAFSSSFDNYKILISGGVTASPGSVTMQLNNSTGATYGFFGYFGNYGTASLTPYASVGFTQWTDIAIGGTAGFMSSIELMSPFATKPTIGTLWSSSTATAYSFAMRDTAAVSNTGFTLTGLGGNTLTGGTIKVYGYRN